MNIYLQLTELFNKEKLRAIICSRQAVVLHRLAIMSKDGDWILREEEEALNHILKILAAHGAHYRFGAPLDLRWLKGGWSSHLEFQYGNLRVRTDFFTRPPRIAPNVLQNLWKSQEGKHPAFVGVSELAELKKTNREKDYVILGELARKITDIDGQIFYSRSARDLMELKTSHPDAWQEGLKKREILQSATLGLESLEAALDREKRLLIRENEVRLDRYEKASTAWSVCWQKLSKQNNKHNLMDTHANLIAHAEGVLPYEP
ncbi:MAG: hypothetical protein SH807_11225 [Blastochloris sp.]|nr:hypothetical protein [Blastochloris sp.]